MTVTETGRFGPYGGRYVPETLIPALDELGGPCREIIELRYFGGLSREDDFSIARQRDVPDTIRVIRQRDAANLGIIIGRDRDFHRQTDALIAAPELGHMRIELHRLILGWHYGRLVRSRP